MPVPRPFTAPTVCAPLHLCQCHSSSSAEEGQPGAAQGPQSTCMRSVPTAAPPLQSSRRARGRAISLAGRLTHRRALSQLGLDAEGSHRRGSHILPKGQANGGVGRPPYQAVPRGFAAMQPRPRDWGLPSCYAWRHARHACPLPLAYRLGRKGALAELGGHGIDHSVHESSVKMQKRTSRCRLHLRARTVGCAWPGRAGAGRVRRPACAPNPNPNPSCRASQLTFRARDNRACEVLAVTPNWGCNHPTGKQERLRCDRGSGQYPARSRGAKPR